MYSPQDSTVYIVDDDVSVREGMAWLLRTRRLLSESFDSAEAFAAMLEKTMGQPMYAPQQAGCILLDVRMPGMSGLALFEQLLAHGIAHAWPVIFLTGHADVPLAIEAVRAGVKDFIEKPFAPEHLVEVVRRALEKRALTLEVGKLRRQLAERDDLGHRDDHPASQREVLHATHLQVPGRPAPDRRETTKRQRQGERLEHHEE